MCSWVRLARIARLGLGGVIVGSFVGVYTGALVGLCYGAYVGRLAPALDGALLGGAVFALLGGCYGIALGLTERANPPAVREMVPGQAPAARCLDPNPSPKWELANARPIHGPTDRGSPALP